ncbi:phosphonate C-P lyase system protein PhnH [Brooklawnia cerclae]|uniref:Alpha-D-ribose 1-methylphosphonate 5-triphosphate synthase subunit PhnH n=1 Tax=Brooklawnia cerclae TaxID=349934 RepID=A0ABX0SMN4_9ACTN|nr:phosphonate C-P lyase system protein PhnH [Brooklawnia cerclae]NIH57997.1 alpha-D-ribose 1-methylphosphonate 5-triphosphate synthase subunit PhnH [Brooklawnia cerclae]
MTAVELTPDTAQRVFRRCLEALAHPGTILGMGSLAPDRPATHLPLLALTDLMVSVAPLTAASRDAVHGIAALTGARVGDVGRARFVLADETDPAAMRGLPVGTSLSPHEGALLVQRTTTLDAGLPVWLSGPGIDGSVTMSAGLDPQWWSARAELCAAFPRGIDVLLVDDAGRVAGLPRTSHASVGSVPEGASA